jgi:hypothetical protein
MNLLDRFSFCFHFSEQTNHFAESIITYFDTALSTMLLYAVERSQYKQVENNIFFLLKNPLLF